MAKTDLTNQRQVFVEEYVRSGDNHYAGDAVQSIRDGVLDDLTGLGTGELRAHFDEIITGGGRLYLSGMSSKGRGVTDEDLQVKPAEFAKPNVLVQLALDHDRMFTY
jgi:hypothetical protein